MRLVVPLPLVFPAQFWLAARNLARDPLASSIPVWSGIAYFRSDLLRYIPIPQASLRMVTRVRQTEINLNTRFLDNTSWQRESLEKLTPFRLAREIAAGAPYRETEAYGILKDRMLAGKLRSNRLPLDSEEKLDRYCEYVQWLIDSVREHGLQSRRNAVNLYSRAFDAVREDETEQKERDIHVGVDERGEFLRIDSGRHRISVAHALGMQEVPAKIHLVHVRWLQHLTQEYGGPPHRALRRWLGSFKSAAGHAPPERSDANDAGTRSGETAGSLR